jgi:hypothetical protein
MGWDISGYDRLTMKDPGHKLASNLNLCFSTRPRVKDYGRYARIKILGHRPRAEDVTALVHPVYPRPQRALARKRKRTLAKRVVCLFLRS